MNIRLPEDFSPEERRDRAENNFLQGYNCTQSVVLAFSDILENNNLATRDFLAVLCSGFGGGMGRLREVCGAFSGTVMMAGFISPADKPKIMSERSANYALVQEFAEKFKDENGGSIVCRELLGLSPEQRQTESPMPSARTAEYYRKRPCPKIVAAAAYIVAKKMIELSD